MNLKIFDKISEKRTFLIPWYARRFRIRALEMLVVSFSENFEYILHEWPLITYSMLTLFHSIDVTLDPNVVFFPNKFFWQELWTENVGVFSFFVKKYFYAFSFFFCFWKVLFEVTFVQSEPFWYYWKLWDLQCLLKGSIRDIKFGIGFQLN